MRKLVRDVLSKFYGNGVHQFLLLARYPKGWRGDKAEVDAEYAKNKAIGEATGCWKNGTLVEDDHGSVHKYMEANGLL